jgi:hypothetical protein
VEVGAVSDEVDLIGIVIALLDFKPSVAHGDDQWSLRSVEDVSSKFVHPTVSFVHDVEASFGA